MNGESGNAPRELAVLTRKTRSKKGQVDWAVLKAGFVCLLLFAVFYVLWQYYPPMNELVDQYRFLVAAPLLVLVFFFLGRLILLTFRQLRK